MSTADEIITHFNMSYLDEEGGYFVRTYSADREIYTPDYPDKTKLICGAILYLLKNREVSFSGMHKLLTDEIYHFYKGDPVEMLLLYPDGTTQQITLGHDVLNGQHVQFNVPAGVWQGSHVIEGGDYALMGTTMAPAYDDADREMGDRNELVEKYPDAADKIRQLTHHK